MFEAGEYGNTLLSGGGVIPSHLSGDGSGGSIGRSPVPSAGTVEALGVHG